MIRSLWPRRISGVKYRVCIGFCFNEKTILYHILFIHNNTIKPEKATYLLEHFIYYTFIINNHIYKYIWKITNIKTFSQKQAP